LEFNDVNWRLTVTRNVFPSCNRLFRRGVNVVIKRGPRASAKPGVNQRVHWTVIISLARLLTRLLLTDAVAAVVAIWATVAAALARPLPAFLARGDARIVAAVLPRGAAGVRTLTVALLALRAGVHTLRVAAICARSAAFVAAAALALLALVALFFSAATLTARHISNWATRAVGVTRGRELAGKKLTPEGDKKSRGGYDMNPLTIWGGLGVGPLVPTVVSVSSQVYGLQWFMSSARQA
jgi:hypothetical protein